MQRQAATPSGGEWRAWVERVLLFLGAAQVIAGIFFFFAYNWDDLTRWQKLGTTQACFVLSALAARFAGLDTAVGKVFLLAAGALVGATFAVYGQVYQTGADAFDLFANWGAVILGWVLIARFAALWILWAVIVNVALALYLDTFTGLHGVEQFLLFGLLNGGFLLLRETARPHFDWLAHPWSRWVVMAACLFFLALAAVDYLDGLYYVRGIMIEGWAGEGTGPLFYLALPAFLVAAAALYIRSRGPNRDLFGLFQVILAVSLVAWFGAIHAIHQLTRDDGIEALASTGVSLAVFGLAGWWLHRIWIALQSGPPRPGTADDG